MSRALESTGGHLGQTRLGHGGQLPPASRQQNRPCMWNQPNNSNISQWGCSAPSSATDTTETGSGCYWLTIIIKVPPPAWLHSWIKISNAVSGLLNVSWYTVKPRWDLTSAHMLAACIWSQKLRQFRWKLISKLLYLWYVNIEYDGSLFRRWTLRLTQVA